MPSLTPSPLLIVAFLVYYLIGVIYDALSLL
jgi:hypothetical protein